MINTHYSIVYDHHYPSHQHFDSERENVKGKLRLLLTSHMATIQFGSLNRQPNLLHAFKWNMLLSAKTNSSTSTLSSHLDILKRSQKPCVLLQEWENRYVVIRTPRRCTRIGMQEGIKMWRLILLADLLTQVETINLQNEVLVCVLFKKSTVQVILLMC